MRVNYRECEHLGGLPSVALAGGDLAAKQPWRNLLAQCLRFVPDWQRYPETSVLQHQNWNVLARAIERGLTHRWRHRADGCLMPLPPRFNVRRNR